MSYDITGEIIAIQDKQTFASGFEKQEIVINASTDDRYPNKVPIEFVKDKIALLQNVRVGDTVKISFDVRGREYNDRYFVNLSGWKIANADGSAFAAPADTHDSTPASRSQDAHNEAKSNGYQPQEDAQGGADDDSIPFAPFPSWMD